MKPIRDREIDLQIRQRRNWVSHRALHSPAGEVSGAGGSPFTGLDWKVTVD
jgi:hypothetical protein